MDSLLTEGWGFPRNSRKAHYFIETMALCRKYGFYRGMLVADVGISVDDCAACRKVLNREPTPGQPAAGGAE